MEGYAAQAGDGAFNRARDGFESLAAWLAGPEAGGLEHGELEQQVQVRGREVLRLLFQDHVDLRAAREPRLGWVSDADGVARGSVEVGHDRTLATVVGEVSVSRMAYRRRGLTNLYPADGLLNLPDEKHSHGLRRLAAVESARGSFAEAAAAIERSTGTTLGKRQVEQLARGAAVDMEDFYAARRPDPGPAGDVLVLTCDGKGVVMRPDALREATAKAAGKATRKLTTRLSKGEKRNRKRMAEVGCVYDCTPTVRTAEDIIATGGEPPKRGPAGPTAAGKWLIASVQRDTTEVVAALFDEADRRDPDHRRTLVALVDGNRHQLDRIRAEARARRRQVSIVVDFIHVLEYLWKATWCFFSEGDPQAEAWVAEKAHNILKGQAGQVAGAIRRKATYHDLSAGQRKNADTCANYLTSQRRYLNYPNALEQGWPIATGVIEGACRFLVKDRMDVTGARWGLAGAEAVLKLRALISNGDFDEYWTYHLHREKRRVHQARYLDHVIPA